MALRQHVRLAVFERDNYCCRYCGVFITVHREYHEWARRWIGLIHVDHIIPRCKGGTDNLENLVTACRKCNLTKYDNVWEPRPIKVPACA